ncbi:MAG: histidine kinase [Desulfuromonadales bacterium C00003094]|jgi:two-component system chemotaxis response regulator CheY|nr:MAG: histidine kinase [Desulfuromonadales bacterium C00003094]OEU77193.1 MAG: histidine kinase [Desulfuromonadales bacterium C00003107]
MNRIVIADDSATARMFIRRCLEIIGLGEATLVEAENGREALALLKEEDTDLLLTDLNMPVMDGATLLKWVKSSPRLHDLPVLVITSAGNAAKEQELLALGAFGVLNKPVSPVVLRDALQSLIS